MSKQDATVGMAWSKEVNSMLRDQRSLLTKILRDQREIATRLDRLETAMAAWKTLVEEEAHGSS